MSIVRWNPFSETVSLREAIDRLFEDSIVRPWPAARPSVAAVPLDIYATENEIVVKASLPGVKPEEVEITVEGDVLTIKGESKGEEEVKKEHYVRQEHYYGAFYRQVTLPAGVRGAGATATYENGILTIKVPKAEEAKPKQIKIETNGKK